jgi:hypothetical protein
MGEVVDMTGRLLSSDDHPFGDDVAHCTEGEKKLLRAAWDEAPDIARYFADRHGLDYDDAVICLIHSLLREAEQCLDTSDEAAGVYYFIYKTFYSWVENADDSSESS